MNDQIDDSILLEAIKKWGVDAQLELIEEECLELALALQKLKRKRGDPKEKIRNVIDEIADVKIMIRQAEKLFDPPAVEERVKFKMDRLAARLIEGIL